MQYCFNERFLLIIESNLIAVNTYLLYLCSRFRIHILVIVSYIVFS